MLIPKNCGFVESVINSGAHWGCEFQGLDRETHWWRAVCTPMSAGGHDFAYNLDDNLLICKVWMRQVLATSMVSWHLDNDLFLLNSSSFFLAGCIQLDFCWNHCFSYPTRVSHGFPNKNPKQLWPMLTPCKLWLKGWSRSRALRALWLWGFEERKFRKLGSSDFVDWKDTISR